MKKYTEEYIKRAAKASLYPDQVYKKTGWINWPKFLGTRNRLNIISYEKCKKEARKLKITTKKMYNQYYKEGKLPDNLPCAPDQVYKKTGWINWPKFLGTRDTSNFVSYEECKKIIRKLKITSNKIYSQYAKEGKLPDNLPYAPDKVYKDKGWENWIKFLGKNKYVTYEECKKETRKLKIILDKMYKQYYKENKLPDNFPKYPEYIYKKTGWNGWAEFLGKNK